MNLEVKGYVLHKHLNASIGRVNVLHDKLTRALKKVQDAPTSAFRNDIAPMTCLTQRMELFTHTLQSLIEVIDANTAYRMPVAELVESFIRTPFDSYVIDENAVNLAAAVSIHEHDRSN